MYASILPVSIAYYYLWNPPVLSDTDLFLYLLCMAVVIRTFITFYEIPSTALAPELTENYDERTTLMSFRYFFAWTGGLLLSIYAYTSLLLPSEGDTSGTLNLAGYETYGLIAALMMAATILASSAGTHHHIPRLKAPPAKRVQSLGEVLAEMRETLNDRSFFSLFGFGMFTGAAGGLVAAMNIYLNTYFWELRAAQIGLLLPAGLVAATIALFVAPILATRVGKKSAAIGLSVAAALIAPIPYTAGIMGWTPPKGSDELVYVLVAYNIVEIALIIASTTLVSAMMADLVEASELKTGRRSEGIFFAARSFIQKSMSAFGLIFASTLLVFVEFPNDAKPGMVDPDIIRNMAIGYVPAMMTLYVLGFLCLFGYRITREDHEGNLEALHSRERH
jgi:GPH family glycoside/pentoside/hexuronide:cation symporter